MAASVRSHVAGRVVVVEGGLTMSAEGTRTAGGASDSPRYCATCDDYGEHHTDRHPAGAERQQEQARTFTVWACRNCGIEEHQWTGTVRATPRCKPGFTHVFETVEVVERAPFEERVRREERDRIVATLRPSRSWSVPRSRSGCAGRNATGSCRRCDQLANEQGASNMAGVRRNALADPSAADHIESLPVSPGPEEGEQ
jgi:hypothetical protein